MDCICFLPPLAPPSAVQNLRIDAVSVNAVSLAWDRPATPGRRDLQYSVAISDPNQVGVFLPLRVLLDTSSTVVLPVTGLSPDTTYMFKVTTQNGVSQFDAGNDALREVQVTGSTTASRKSLSNIHMYSDIARIEIRIIIQFVPVHLRV